MIPLQCGSCWRCGMVVRVRGFLRGLRGVLSGWIEMNFDDVVEGSDQSLRGSGRNQRKIVVRGIIIVPWSYTRLVTSPSMRRFLWDEDQFL